MLIQLTFNSVEEMLHWMRSFDVTPQKLPTQEQLEISVRDMPINARTLNSLLGENIQTVGDLLAWNTSDLLGSPNFGRKSLNDIKSALSSMGLALPIESKRSLTKEQL